MNNEDLIKRIEALEKWKVGRERQQITLPLDPMSLAILNKFFVSIVGDYVYLGGTGSRSFQVFSGKQGQFQFNLTPGLIEYIAEPTTDIVTIVEKTPINRFVNTQTVVLYTTDAMPGGLSGQGLTTYYVVSAAADGYSFKLSLSSGGAAIDITSAGTGKQLMEKF